MVILAIWLLVTFVGLSFGLLLTGFVMQDKRWFQRLGFSEDAQDVADGDYETEMSQVAVHFTLFVVGVITYVVNPTASRPITPLSLLTGVLFTAVPVLLIVFSVRRQRRRDRIESRSRERAIAAAGR